jgi:hypothetical protein
MGDDLMEMVLKACKQSFQVAFETAVRTGTALVVTRKGKQVEFKPPYRYELVPIKPSAKKKASRQKKTKGSHATSKD